ncbi:MAG: LpxA family transferase [Chlamydiales bacterium]|nr:LpxA family transferase [Chlamydiales bacterium]
MNFESNYFFSLDSYTHKALFDSIDYVWKALLNIDTYFKNYSLGNIEVPIPDGAYLVNKDLISIGQGTIVEPGSYIKGPCIIGKNCSIRHGAYIRGSLIAGDDCVIGHDTEVKHSILLNHAVAGHFAYIGDSILGNHVNLGAGTICANLRLDREQIIVHYEGKKFKTNLKKMGVIIGDHSQTGCNAVTNPGTLMGKSVMCYPCTNFGGFIPTRMFVKPSTTILTTPF